MINTVGKENLMHLIDLQKAKALFDQDRERQKEIKQTKELALRILENNEPVGRSDLAINGNDLKELGYSGPLIKKVLDELLKLVYLKPEANSKTELKKYLKRYA